jgi:hypothetical protein
MEPVRADPIMELASFFTLMYAATLVLSPALIHLVEII